MTGKIILPEDVPTGRLIITKNAERKVILSLHVFLCKLHSTIVRIMKISSKNVSVSRDWSSVRPDKSVSANPVTESTRPASAIPSLFPVMPSRTDRGQAAAVSLSAVSANLLWLPVRNPVSGLEKHVTASMFPVAAMPARAVMT